ncbi:MAG: class II aldolase/adducin family protein [Desulfovibrionaceae bacterium]
MERLVEKYAGKLVRAGLAQAPLVAGLDDEIVWNSLDEASASLRRELEQVFAGLNINSLVFARPAEPYAGIMDWLAGEALEENADDARIMPEDCETRTFLHDLPVCRECNAATLAEALGRRKCCIVPGLGVAAHGTVSPEQGFVTFSSTCFSCFVLFFSRYLRDVRAGQVSASQHAAFERAVAHLDPPRTDLPELMRGPFTERGPALAAMAEAGRATVEYGLVDSYFGNVSLMLPDKVLLISQTGSSLDELEGYIDPCPLDGSSTACLTASSELTAHLRSYELAGARREVRAILHGHPRFSVILSMDCPDKDCAVRRAGQCHARCPKTRSFHSRAMGEIVIVPGEVGTGPTGLCNTLPPALAGRRAALVYGHGLFALGRIDFRDAFVAMLEVENDCRDAYFAAVQQAQAGTVGEGA